MTRGRSGKDRVYLRVRKALERTTVCVYVRRCWWLRGLCRLNIGSKKAAISDILAMELPSSLVAVKFILLRGTS